MKNNKLRKIVPFFSWDERPLFFINTNALKLGDFKLGSFAKSLEVHPKFEQNSKLFQVECLERRIEPYNYKHGFSFKGISGSFQANEIRLTRSLGKFGLASLVLKNLISNSPIIEFNPLMKSYSLLRLSKIRPIIELLTDIIFINLLRNGYLCLHAASFVVNGNAYLLAGYPDTGKTYTTLKMVKSGALFLAEDIVILDQKGLVYGLPFTQTVEKRQPLIGINRLVALYYETLLKMNYSKVTPLDLEYINSKNICASAKLKGIFFLKRGEPKIIKKSPSISALKDLRNNNRMEFTYWHSDIIMSYLYFNEQETVEGYMDLENKLIGDIFKDIDYYDAYAFDQKGYKPLIFNYLNLDQEQTN